MREFYNQYRILEVITGSNLYGTNTINSDKDYVGIFIAPKQYYLGLEQCNIIDMSQQHKLPNGKNSSDSTDMTAYEFRKFIKLAVDNSPNVIEILFSNSNNIVEKNIIGESLLNNRHLFPWKGAAQKFLGYAFSQKHKMIVKVDNYNGLNEFVFWYEDNIRNKNKELYFANQLIAEFRDSKLSFLKFSSSHVSIGDLNLPLSDRMKKVYSKVTERLSKVGNREELFTKYGYDVKFGMHLVRLMLEGKELLQTGEIQFPLKDRELLLDIRHGKWKKEEIIQYSEELEKEIEFLKESSPLPSKPRYEEINNFLIKTVENFHRSQS